MKLIHYIFLFAILFGISASTQAKEKSKNKFHQLSFTLLNGNKVDFSTFKGKKVLIVNTASKCGFTPQYAELQILYDQYKENLIILGFPSNDFGKQEPGTNQEIGTFCQVNYNISFLMMEKSNVTGKEKNAVYQWLTDKKKNGWNTTEPSWNFCKYLVDENGKLLKFFPAKVKPISTDITDLL